MAAKHLRVRVLDDLLERLRHISITELTTIMSILKRRDQEGGLPDVDQLKLDAVADILLLMDSDGSKLRAVEQALVHAAARRADGNKSEAARILGIDRKSLERKLKRPLAKTTPRAHAEEHPSRKGTG